MIRAICVLILLSLLYGCAPAPTSEPSARQQPAPSVEAQGSQPAEPPAAVPDQPAAERTVAAPEEPVAEPSSDTVYVTKTGERYHRAGCSSLSRSSIAMGRQAAIDAGYRACSNCSP